MNTVILAKNPMEPDTWTTHEVSDVREFLVNEFTEWPDTARIYHNQVSVENDVTPTSEYEVEKLGELSGTFYVIVYPGGLETIAYVVIAIVVVAAVVMASNVKVPSTALKNTQNPSSNNELSDRSNKARPLNRIPDIYGTVRSTPDLLSNPYKVFENNTEVEYSYMCIGRGYYDVSDIKDDTTLTSEILGTSVEVFDPFTSPNSGDEPVLRVGSEINEPLLDAVRSNSVNGQVLLAPNFQTVRGNNNIRFVSPNKIQSSSSLGIDFTSKFSPGSELTITNAVAYSQYINDSRTIIAHSSGYFYFEVSSATVPSGYAAGKECTLIGASFYRPQFDSESGSTTNVFSFDLSGIYTISSVSAITVTNVPVYDSGSMSDIYVTKHYAKIQLVSPENYNPSWSLADGLAPDASWTSSAEFRGSKATPLIRLNDGSVIYDLNGPYTILSVTQNEIILDDPESVDADWSTIGTTNYISPTLSSTGQVWIGPFILDKNNLNQVFCNFVALNGLYKDDGNNQYPMNVNLELEVTPLNADNTVRGPVETFTDTLYGSSTYRSTMALTLKANLSLSGRCSIRAKRVTPSDTGFNGSVVDEVKWRDAYAVAPVNNLHFGNVTTIHSVTLATSGALAIKERKLNMLVTRKLPLRVSGSTFTTTLHPTNSADEIFSAVCLDPYVGNRSVSEIDFNTIYDTVNEVKTYFGHPVAGEFSYTFDSKNLSFEETAQMIANAIFCTAFRRGNIIKLSFDKQTEDSTLLFNHRNKLPGTENRTIRFGNQDNYDGISYQYVDPEDDAIVTYYIPEDRSAINPQEIESIGVRSRLQAHFHAWREWNKVRYRNTIVEFQATQEADLLVPQDRILISDGTRSGVQDGEVISQNALQLELSQPVSFKSGVNYSVFLQHVDGSTESIPCIAGSNSRSILLEFAPRLSLALDDNLFARTTFLLVGDDESRENAFLVVEKSSQSNMTLSVKAVNYDSRYYSNDSDYINSIVDENGNFL